MAALIMDVCKTSYAKRKETKPFMLKAALYKCCLVTIILGIIPNQPFANERSLETFPHKNWSYYESVEQAGFIPNRLEKVEKFYQKRAFAGLLIVKNGAIAVDWGENDRRFLVHSIRKSMLSALYGVHSADIDLQTNLKELGVDDNGALSEQERAATLLDILSSRSGVYLPAAAEGGEMVSSKPDRHSYPPGSHWFYNNWDFNVAGSIYTQLTGESIPKAFMRHIATPLQMQDFRELDSYYVRADSEHQAVQFRMSSRDLARLGLLYARNGNWRGKQIIPQHWIEASTQAVSQTNMGDKYPPHYGYMWWVESDGSYSARGVGGHVLAVYPDLDMIAVLRTNTYLEHSVSARAIKKILEGIKSASEGQLATSPSIRVGQEKQDFPQILPARYQNKLSKIDLASGQNVTLRSDEKNIFVKLDTGELELVYVKDNQFNIIDRQEPLEISLNSEGEITDIRTPRLFYLQAAHVAQQGDLDTALFWVKQVISMLPESSIAYTNMAKIYIAKDDISSAQKMLSEALRHDPNNKQANGLQQTVMIKKWLLPTSFALGVIVLLIVFWVLKKRKMKSANLV